MDAIIVVVRNVHWNVRNMRSFLRLRTQMMRMHMMRTLMMRKLIMRMQDRMLQIVHSLL